MEIDNTKKYGVKLTVISAMDYDDLSKIAESIKKLGYRITVSENGVWVINAE